MSFDAHSSTIKQCWEHVSIFGLRSTSLVLGPAQKRRSTGRSWKLKVTGVTAIAKTAANPALEVLDSIFKLVTKLFLCFTVYFVGAAVHHSVHVIFLRPNPCAPVSGERTFLQIGGPVTFQFALAASIFMARAHIAFHRTTWWQRKKYITILNVTHWMTSRKTQEIIYVAVHCNLIAFTNAAVWLAKPPAIYSLIDFE